jgi:hypothetical protein
MSPNLTPSNQRDERHTEMYEKGKVLTILEKEANS